MIYISPSIMLYVVIYFIRFIIVICYNDWFIIWIGLELNIFRFILIIYKHMDQKVVESCLKYFFVQRVGSALFLFILFSNLLNNNICIIILRYKLGVGPFFYWFPNIILGLDWFNCFMLIGFQKVLPIYLIYLFNGNVMWFLIFLRLIIGGVGIINQTRLKLLFSYSRIHYLGWLLLLLNFRIAFWIIYLFIYIIIFYPIFIFFIKGNINYLNELSNKEISLLFMIIIISIAGLPPMLGFFLKISVFKIIFNIDFIILFLIIIFSVLIIYVYIKVCYNYIIRRRFKGFEVIEYKIFNYIRILRFTLSIILCIYYIYI